MFYLSNVYRGVILISRFSFGAVTNFKMQDDILREIPDENLSLLRDLYQNHQREAPHVYSLICNCIAWKTKKPDSNYVTVFGASDDWLKTGTFIVVMQYGCYDIFIYTLEEDFQTLRKVLSETAKIDWTRKIWWYCVSEKHLPTLTDVLKERRLPIRNITVTHLYVVERQTALKYEFDCPEDIYLKKLERSHAPLINDEWPHKSDDSEEYIATLIEMGDCYAFVAKSDGGLACWTLRSPLGQMCSLQTADEHQRKGYATLITKIVSKRIAEDGYHPLGTIVVGNVASEKMFEKLGFRSVDTCSFVRL